MALTDQAIRVLPRRLEPLLEQSFEVNVTRTIQATDDIYVLLFPPAHQFRF